MGGKEVLEEPYCQIVNNLSLLLGRSDYLTSQSSLGSYSTRESKADLESGLTMNCSFCKVCFLLAECPGFFEKSEDSAFQTILCIDL